jgi:hypothetical protein
VRTVAPEDAKAIGVKAMQGGDKGGSCGKGAREDAPPAVHTMGAAATRRAWAASSQYPLESF